MTTPHSSSRSKQDPDGPVERQPLLGRVIFPRTAPLPERRVDLHVHSSASNGATGKPADIARTLKVAGYSAFSLTEHDTLASQEAAAQGALAAGIDFVPGLEVSTRIDDPALSGQPYAHILGYFFRPSAELEAMVARTYEVMVAAFRAAFARLREQGIIRFDEEELRRHTRAAWGEDDLWKQPFNCPIPLTQMLEKEGLPASALGLKYPPDGFSAWPTVREVCDTLHRAGAVVVLAHPTTATRPQLRHWLDRYGDGIEVYHPRNSPEYRQMLLEVVRETGCAFTGGSDTHWFGWDNMDELYSDAPYTCLESLRQAQDHHA